MHLKSYFVCQKPDIIITSHKPSLLPSNVVKALLLLQYCYVGLMYDVLCLFKVVSGRSQPQLGGV